MYESCILVETSAFDESLAFIYLSIIFPRGSCSLYPCVALTSVCFSYLRTVSKVVKMRLCGFFSSLCKILTSLHTAAHSVKFRPLMVAQARQQKLNWSPVFVNVQSLFNKIRFEMKTCCIYCDTERKNSKASIQQIVTCLLGLVIYLI